MTDNHNTLDDLVRVAEANVPRCESCCGYATVMGHGNGMRRRLCDRCWKKDERVSVIASLPVAPAIRRLIASGVLK